MNFPGTHTFYVGLCWHCKSNGSTLQPHSSNGPTVQPLQRCGGCLVSYCSRDCQKDDRLTHKYICKEFPVVDGKNVLYTTRPWMEHIASLLERAARLPNAEGFATPLFINPWVCKTCHEASRECLTVCKCLGVSYCSRKCRIADKLHNKECSQLDDMIHHCSMRNGCLAYPRSLYYALLKTPEFHDRLKHLSTLVIHVITGNTMTDSMYREDAMQLFWEEGFAHQFPKLKNLKLFFIMQDKVNNKQFFLKKGKAPYKPFTCEDCESAGRVITYSIQQMKYHMFFSSEEYTKPDVVAIYGSTQEMSTSGDNETHSEISYRNITHNHDTIIVMMDATKDLLRQGVKAMNDVQPVELIIPIQLNHVRGFPVPQAAINEKYYFTCLNKK